MSRNFRSPMPPDSTTTPVLDAFDRAILAILQRDNTVAQREIARALLNDPKLILADEPTGNLDPETSGQILQLLHDICKKGTTVVMTTHNYTLVRNYPARIVKCENGFLSDLSNEKEGE